MEPSRDTTQRMTSEMPVVPTPEQCEAILRAAGIDEPLTQLDIVPVPDYSVNIVCFLNDDYVLRASTADGEQRFRREQDALDRLRHIPEVPRVIDAGTVVLDRPAHYLLQTRMPGDTVISQWPDTPPATRRRLVEDLIAIVRQVHRIPAETYAIGFYGTAEPALRDWTGSWLDGHDRYVVWLLEAIRRRDLTGEQSALADDAERFYAAHRTALAYQVGPRMAHGDLHLYNVLAIDGHVTGLIDWEWSFAGGTEPDFDLEALVRWSLYPQDLGDENEASRFEAEDFGLVIPTMLAAYPELQAIPRLMERMTIYQIEHELHQMISWPPRVPTRPTERLRDWVQHQRLIREYG